MKDTNSLINILQTIETSQFYKRIKDWYTERDRKPFRLNGCAGSLLSSLTAFLFRNNPSTILVIAEDLEAGDRIYDDLATLVSSDNVYLFESIKKRFEESLEMEEQIGHVEVIDALSRRTDIIIVATPEALITSLPHPTLVKNNILSITKGHDYDFNTFTDLLMELGFEKKKFVEDYGDFSVRGSIIDVFPFTGNSAVRIEFSDNTVESVREFNIITQCSVGKLETVRITPNLIGKEGNITDLFDHLDNEAHIIWSDRDAIKTVAAKNEEIQNVLNKTSRFRQLYHYSLFLKTVVPDVEMRSSSQPSFHGSLEHLVKDLRNRFNSGYKLFITSGGKEESERIRELIEETEQLDGKKDDFLPVQYIPETLQTGFIIDAIKILCYTEHEIFGRLKRRRARRRKRFIGFSLHEMQALKRGDFIVHIDHGIGRFDGLKKIKVGRAGNGAKPVEQECAKIVYSDGDVLYVNLNSIHRIQKYSSKEGHIPAVSKLGSGDWEKIKERTKGRVKDIARELILLYAKRKNSEGFAFSKDSHWQKELEASFIYEDTPDQEEATRSVKMDMELPIPMDRLICGDVGFGKTEVALRAAFKAVRDKKQVVILVPTTILAEQHYNTFCERLENYQINISVLSRFRTYKEQQTILKGLQEGTVDIVIGTHRLLSKDVAFKNPGLLITDEEHRFGVTAKEKIRKLKENIDTLTLTATPIPRTLNFSLMGARDLSIINTPPRNRLPIITTIAPFSKEIMREAIQKELEREGQVYVVHHRIADIEKIADDIRELVPEALVRVAHGRMNARALEKVMIDFLHKKFNILVSTKIIESGIDIPSVNTIIITRSDKFGLAELYQLRGRVGRSTIQAYAYLFTPPISTMTKQAIRRLHAIEEYTGLGSGFNLAMRDLEIRGAGNLLGREQSGFIEEVGFELYQKLVDDAVRELKEGEFRDLFPEKPQEEKLPEMASVNLGINAYIPDTYVEYDNERLELYRRLYGVTSEKELSKIRNEIIDRFGTLPEAAEALIKVIALRVRASRLGFERVDFGPNGLKFRFPGSTNKAYFSSEIFQRVMERIKTLQRYNTHLVKSDQLLTLSVALEYDQGEKSPLNIAFEITEHLALSSDNAR